MNHLAQGIDVSHHQGKIDWKAVAETQHFAFIRCAYGCKEDRTVKANWKASESTVLARGVYQYYRADQDGLEQANFALHYGDGAELPMVLDFERDDYVDAADQRKMASDIEAWVHRVSAYRGRPIIYTNLSWLLVAPYVEGWVTDECCLWVADVNGRENPVEIKPWLKPTFWQHSWTGKFDGIRGDVDLNWWLG
jgi:lysozyme